MLLIFLLHVKRWKQVAFPLVGSSIQEYNKNVLRPPGLLYFSSWKIVGQQQLPPQSYLFSPLFVAWKTDYEC